MFERTHSTLPHVKLIVVHEQICPVTNRAESKFLTNNAGAAVAIATNYSNDPAYDDKRQREIDVVSRVRNLSQNEPRIKLQSKHLCPMIPRLTSELFFLRFMSLFPREPLSLSLSSTLPATGVKASHSPSRTVEFAVEMLPNHNGCCVLCCIQSLQNSKIFHTSMAFPARGSRQRTNFVSVLRLSATCPLV